MRQVLERKVRLDGTHEDFMCERLVLEPGKRAVLRYRVDREWRVAGGALIVPAGSVNLAHYWMDRPYNVYQFMSEGRTLAYYCNVAEPTAIREELVKYIDLAVDVLLRPGEPALVLDEEELPPDLDPRYRIIVARAIEGLADPGPVIREVEDQARRYL